MAPLEGCSNPAIRRSWFVFPHPEGPRSETISPEATEKLTSFTPTTEPKDLQMFLRDRISDIILSLAFVHALADDLVEPDKPVRDDDYEKCECDQDA